jgi:hypothetical protein
LFYAAVHFQSTNPQWKDFGTLNEYIARVQSFLQQGKPANDVLLYYPIIDRYSEPGRELLQHFDGMERNFENTGFEHVSKWMLENGYGFDFFSDRQLQNISFNGKLRTGGNEYQTILLPANKLVSEKSFQKIMALAKAGATILIYKNLPQDVPGWGQLEQRRKQFQQLTGQLHFEEKGNVKKAVVGKGLVLIADDMAALLKEAGVLKPVETEAGLSSIRRKNDDGNTYFINNRTDKPVNQWVKIQADARSVALFDPMFAKSGLAKWKASGKGMIEVLVMLQPYESVIIRTYNSVKTGTVFPYLQMQSASKEINGKWTIEFLSGGPVLPAKITTDRLGSWTEAGGDELKNFSGVAKYSIDFEKPAGATQAWVLDLGKVNETAEVFLNGKKLATLIGPVFQTGILSSELKATNHLEIVVANLMANRISYMDRNNLPWKIFYNTNMPARKKENVKNGLFDASSWKSLPSGLSGPVTLAPTTIVQ